MFDYNSETIRHEWNVDLPTEEKEWNIGLIVGASGTGKTTISSQMFPEMHFHQSKKWGKGAVIDGFADHIQTKDICSMFNSVGFSSPPSWLKPYHVLSNGQKFRVDLAKSILENDKGVIFDEFTSVVDRNVAQIGCAALEKAIRKKGMPPFIAVSCHYDIIDWLQPDWIYDVSASRFDWRLRRRRPEISIKIYRTTTSSWRIFKAHHYLDTNIHKGAECFVATWEDRPVAFSSVIHFPHPRCSKFKKGHRTVVLPDFQGVGIGNMLSEFVAEHYTNKGFRFISTTSAPAMISHRSKSKKWRTARFGRTSKVGRISSLKSFANTVRSNCISAGFEYIGERRKA